MLDKDTLFEIICVFVHCFPFVLVNAFFFFISAEASNLGQEPWHDRQILKALSNSVLCLIGIQHVFKYKALSDGEVKVCQLPYQL